MRWTTFNPLADPCLSCGLHRGKKHPCIRPKEGQNVNNGGQDVNTRGRVVLVGEGPGPDEDRAGEAFVGRSGKLLKQILNELGVLNHVTFLNAVRCHPTDAVGRTRAPRATEISLCRGFTIDDLSRIQPEVIVCLGSKAAESFGITGSISALHRSRFEVRVEDFLAEQSEGAARAPLVTERAEHHLRPHLQGYGLPKRRGGGSGSSDPTQNTPPDALEGPKNRSGGNTPIPLYVTYHPAAGLREGKANLIKELRDDLARILSPGSPGLPIRAVPSPPDRGEGNTKEKVLVVDIETSGFFKDSKLYPFDGGEIILLGADEQ